MKSVILFIFLLVFSLNGFTKESYEKTISFEWDQVPGATAYEIEFTQIINGQTETRQFQMASNKFSGKIKPGLYKMRLRSLDKRNVPGIWSTSTEFPVLLDKVRMISPKKENVEFQSNSDQQDELNFAWNAVDGADRYSLIVKDEADKVIYDNILIETTVKVPMEVSKKYNWKIKALNSEGLTSDEDTVGEFAILGKKLDSPEILKPESEFVREIKWSRNPKVSHYSVELYKYQANKKKWEKVVEDKSYKGNRVVFENKWPGGNYKIILQSNGTLRPSSDKNVLNFKVKTGDRSPAAEYTYTLKKSIDRINGWYGIASWLVTMINYSSSYKSLNPQYSVMGGTGRLGLGWFKENNPWGFSSNIDISGFFKNESSTQAFTYNSLFVSGIYRTTVRQTDEFRIQSGLFYKEVPQTIANITDIANYFNNNNLSMAGYTGTSNQVITMVGPHFGTEYWFSLSPKMGFQVNAQWFYAISALKLPTNGKNFKPSLSEQYGILGSYKLNSKLTGLMGLTYKKDQASYQDDSSTDKFNVDSANEQYNAAKDVSTTINGFYFSLFAEYQF